MEREHLWSCQQKKRTVNGQLKLKKKENINRLVKEKGDPELLEILQYEEKMEFQWKPEWEDLFRGKWDKNTEKRITRMLKHMTMQQLVNRTWKYTGELTDSAKGKGEFWQTFLEYSDYLRMREELGYDMTNEVFIHPKDLDEKHQEMVKEHNARKDEMTIKKKNKEFANIAKRYESLCKRYQAAADGYIIRPHEMQERSSWKEESYIIVLVEIIIYQAMIKAGVRYYFSEARKSLKTIYHDRD